VRTGSDAQAPAPRRAYPAFVPGEELVGGCRDRVLVVGVVDALGVARPDACIVRELEFVGGELEHGMFGQKGVGQESPPAID
jgi:hypothetical protein